MNPVRHDIWTPNRNLAQIDPSQDQCREAVHHGRMGRSQCSKRPRVWETVNGERMGFCRQHSIAEQQKRWDEQADECFRTVAGMTRAEARAAGARVHRLWQRVHKHQSEDSE